MTDPASTSKNLKDYYENVGWRQTGEGPTDDAARWEDLRDCARLYVSGCRKRVNAHIPPGGNRILDIASGPIQYDEYLEYSSGFSKRICVDISSQALIRARQRLGSTGDCVQADIRQLPFAPDSFDCTLSLHTLYHVHESAQRETVLNLIEATRPGRPVVIVYSNPKRLLHYVGKLRHLARWIVRAAREPGRIYFHAFPLSWWRQFSPVAEVRIFPWRSLNATDSKMLIPDNRFGRALLQALFRLESRFPRLFVRFGAYPLIVLTKK